MVKRIRTKGERKNDIQNTAQKTKDRATRTPLKTGVNSRAPDGWVGSSCSTCHTHRVILVTNPVLLHEGDQWINHKPRVLPPLKLIVRQLEYR